MKYSTKPQNIGTFNDGNRIWDAYKFQNEMLSTYQEKLPRLIVEGRTARAEDVKARIEQYTVSEAEAEKNLVEFCQKHNLELK